ncbi:hypothetical protein LX36DRAFT_644595 [Colletotrichum falcatum]|nr:hypothetical protein LX36DRAFT_644595 [Colletotrichum falcatum]
MFLGNLGARLGDRSRRTGSMTDLEEAKACFKEALNTKVSSISQQIDCGHRFLLLPDSLQDIHGAYTVANTVVNLIPLLSPFSLQSADKQHQLRQAAGLASSAAAIALRAGHGPLAALQLLETGRGVFAASVQNIRADLSTLQESHPGLAKDFVRLRDQLDAPAQRGGLEPTQLQLTEPALVTLDSRHEASAEMDSLLHTIRSRPGFGQFLLSATREEMKEAAACGPIVVINVNSHRCDALIVERFDVRVIGLPRLTQASLEERAGDLGSVETLAWLWDVVVGPILDVLGFTIPPADDAWPHVWWVPTGPLTQFPLHAAGHHTEVNAETALDRVVSSYSLSIKSIIHTRQQRLLGTRANMDLKAILLDMEETPGQGRLYHAKVETEAVREVCDSIGLPCNQPLPYKKDVLAVLGSCRILHFAGHGGTRPDPLQSLLLLQDWESNPLTVESLLETNLSTNSPFLAYLSACGTSRVQDNKSVDESIHLTSAFQLAGFRHVIGTFWEVDDAVCVDMARMTYEFMGEKAFSDESVSFGLHRAMRRLRDQWIRTKSVRETNRDGVLVTDPAQDTPTWVPYVHYGV